MTEEQLRRIHAGGQLITDEQRDAAVRCPVCRTSHPVPSMVEHCKSKARP